MGADEEAWYLKVLADKHEDQSSVPHSTGRETACLDYPLSSGYTLWQTPVPSTHAQYTHTRTQNK